MLFKLDRILFISSCVYLLGVSIWIINRDNYHKKYTQTSDNSEQEFITYLQDSLTRIEQQQNQKETPTNIAQQPEMTTQQQIEKVYIPLYQPPQIVTKTTQGDALPPPPAVLPPPLATETITSEVETKVNSTLVGLLESETGAIALFEYNGIIERIEIGKEIGNSGWTVKDIIDNKVLVENNQQTKTLSVGQTF